MRYEYLGQILAGIVIGGILLVGPSLAVFYGWSEWQTKIFRAEIPAWRRIIVSVGVISLTTQTILFLTLVIAIFHFKVLVPYRFFLSWSVFIELILLLVAGPCMFAWQGRFKWWLLASSVYLPVISFFSALAVLAS